MDAIAEIKKFAAEQQTIGEVKAKQEALEGRVQRLEGSIESHLKNIYAKLDRPSWAVVTIITFLSSGFFTMLAIVLTKGH